MSSDLYLYDPDLQFLPCDPLFSFNDSSTAAIDNLLQPNSIDQLLSPDNLNNLFSSSPPCHKLEGLSLYQAIPTNFPDGFHDSGCTLVDLQETVNPLASSFGPHSYSGSDSSNVGKYMQRSYSSNSFEEKPAVFNPQFDALMESVSPDFQGQVLSSPENCFFSGQIRRVCSTGDLQGSYSSPLATEGSFMDETNLKVGRYSAEERKERILKYRAKRTQRNFTKTIKYACRKTLADNRPRIRGRFARNDEIGDLPKAACSTRDDDEDDLWGLQEEEEFGPRPGPFGSNSFSAPQTQFQYYYGS